MEVLASEMFATAWLASQARSVKQSITALLRIRVEMVVGVHLLVTPSFVIVLALASLEEIVQNSSSRIHAHRILVKTELNVRGTESR